MNDAQLEELCKSDISLEMGRLIADDVFELGNKYEAKRPGDLQSAIFFYRKAASWGNSLAAIFLSVVYRNTEGIEPDLQESMKWLKVAIDLGSANAAEFAALRYYYGEGVEKSITMDIYYNRIGAKLGSKTCKLRIARYAWFGLTTHLTDLNTAELIKLFKSSDMHYYLAGYLSGTFIKSKCTSLLDYNILNALTLSVLKNDTVDKDKCLRVIGRMNSFSNRSILYHYLLEIECVQTIPATLMDLIAEFASECCVIEAEELYSMHKTLLSQGHVAEALQLLERSALLGFSDAQNDIIGRYEESGEQSLALRWNRIAAHQRSLLNLARPDV